MTDNLKAIPEDALVLNLLAEENGAILYWQLPTENDVWQPAHAFEDALGRGIIRFDADTDCYVHPMAVEMAAGAYTMRQL